MNSSTLKMVVPIVVLMGVVFALTFFLQYTPTVEEDKPVETKQKKQPLKFYSMTRAWNPMTEASLMDRNFPGFFEPGETQYSTSFWFENRNPTPVEMQLLRVSCTQCSGGQVAAIPPEVSRNLLQMTAVSMLPHGLTTMLPAGMVGPTAHMYSPGVLPWQSHEFSKPPAQVNYVIPAAPTNERWAEPWGILQLNFKAKPGASKGLGAEFLTRFQGAEEAFPVGFTIGFIAAPPFDLDRTQIDLGELTDSSPPQNHDIIVYSSTRKHLPEVSVLVMMPAGVSGEPGPFISAGKPEPVPEDELESQEIRISGARAKALAGRNENPLVRVQSAVRIPVSVRTRIGEAKLDIGQVDRVIAITQGSETKQVVVKGTMKGPIYLAGGSRGIGFGTFTFTGEQSAAVTIETERSGVDLEVVKELTQPKFLKLELTKLTDNGDRGAYRLNAILPAKEQLGEIRDGVVVLQTKGPNPQRLRIPVTGRGRD